MTKNGEPKGVGRGASDVVGSKRGATGRGTRRQKRARGVRLQEPKGDWGVGRGSQDRNLREGSGYQRDGILSGQAVQDQNEGGKVGAKERCSSVLELRMGGGVSTWRVKGIDPENSRTLGRGFKISC